jgi:hypothetical protein
VDRPAARVHHADQVFAGARLDAHPPGQQIPSIEPAGVVNANKTLVIDMADVESDLVDMTGDDDPLGALWPAFSADQAAQRIDLHLVKQSVKFAPENIANAFFTPRHAGRFG